MDDTIDKTVLAPPYKATLHTEIIPNHYEVIEKVVDYFEMYGDLLGYSSVPGSERIGYVAAYTLEDHDEHTKVYATIGLTDAGNRGHVFVRMRSDKPFEGLAKVVEKLHPDLHWG